MLPLFILIIQLADFYHPVSLCRFDYEAASGMVFFTLSRGKRK
ncbi:hypothetical protein [Scopulibacillus daqui]|nr:hypothetical protein [Scopulibacillus daqui]